MEENPLETVRAGQNGNTDCPAISTSVPVSSKEKGKKQSTQLKRFFFTFNNYTEDDVDTTAAALERLSEKFIFQREIGANGTKHLQGAVWLKKRMRREQFPSHGLSQKIHWEPTRNEEAVTEYCQKLETSDGGKIYKGGAWPKPLKIIKDEQLRPWQRYIKDLFFTEPDGRTVNWFWEPKGNVGKTSFVKHMLVTFRGKTTFVRGGDEHNIINGLNAVKPMLEKNEFQMMFWDLPKARKGFISSAAVEAVLDGLAFNSKYECGSLEFNPPHVVVFANYPPEDTTILISDRWNIRRILPDGQLGDKQLVDNPEEDI